MPVGNVMGSAPFAWPTMNVKPAMSNVSGNPDPLTPKAGPVRKSMSEIGEKSTQHDLYPVPPGQGMMSEFARTLAGLDLIHGMDELIGRTDMQLGKAYARELRKQGGTPGDLTTAEACGRLSGPLYA